LNKLYQINDNLFVIIDALIQDSRWDVKFLGMQIMVEGLALGAFGTLYQMTQEPMLKQLLKMVIQDEARHVHYGVLALRDHFRNELSDSERREREDWAFEVALLMRNRFLAFEVYEE
jgi:ribonucleotide reductase beta subunit family protein with ferritin-like domain